ncbi:meiotically up-regulated gene 113-domain-containing protein [Clohesyomyces aquaticus]|uniref:Meiotically up-regulated gene 113-domain-containing protein n=1 Tax=Clohesyomyces aquaticus TaxID=1231657 RepID=A0A1Y2A5D1_9PLEO|nr:meiotically up-regulated gene 113-domain-containing protein [Clohesyomyces aquaticus]
MPFIGHTPESLLPRSDSRNPATTCKGITTSGRPCRRSIGAAKASRDNGVLAVVSVAADSDEDDTGAAAYFCWQHKDQAERLAAANAAAPQQQNTQLYPLQERSSIDTLVARLGVLDFEEIPPARRREKRREDRTPSNRPPRRVNRPPTWDQVQGPLLSVPSDVMAEKSKRPSQRPAPTRPPPRGKNPSFWQVLCCGASAEDDYVEVIRHKKRVQDQPTAVPQGRVNRRNRSPPVRPASSTPGGTVPARKPLGEKPARPLNIISPRPSETSNLLAHIPKSLPPQTASLLLAELSKPISQHDDEGYIYIFWLTSESAGPPPSSAASSLLVPPSRPEQGRRTSDVLRQYSVRQRPDTLRTRSGESNTSNSEKKTILLKIGRASNVHRRMNEWTRQCGYSLSLVRWYPHVPSNSPSPSPKGSLANSQRQSYQNSRPTDPVRRVSEGVRKVPHAHRVERLIHLELGDQRVKKNCEACGKEHREWFEVDATRDGVKAIDEVVKRWVDWAEKAGSGNS